MDKINLKKIIQNRSIQMKLLSPIKIKSKLKILSEIKSLIKKIK